jgi:hypothetical protein
LAVVGALLFSQCSVAWRNFLWARGSGCQSFILLGALFPLSVAPASQQGFWFMELTLSACTPYLPSWILLIVSILVTSLALFLWLYIQAFY